MGFFDFMTEAVNIIDSRNCEHTLILPSDKVVVDEPSIVGKELRSDEVVALGKRNRTNAGNNIKESQLFDH